MSTFKDCIMQIHWLNTGRQAINYIAFLSNGKENKIIGFLVQIYLIMKGWWYPEAVIVYCVMLFPPRQAFLYCLFTLYSGKPY